DIVCGDPNAEERTPAHKGLIELLWDKFGGTINEKGYKVLDPHVGGIYGDGLSCERVDEICQRLEAKGFAASNMVFGLGAWFFNSTRDTFGMAFKATAARIDGKNVDLFKKPVTDNGEKFSAKGRLSVVNNEGKLALIEQATPEQEAESLLVPVWRDGKLLVDHKFQDIRRRLWGDNF